MQPMQLVGSDYPKIIPFTTIVVKNARQKTTKQSSLSEHFFKIIEQSSSLYHLEIVHSRAEHYTC
jgi:hypothetical protein